MGYTEDIRKAGIGIPWKLLSRKSILISGATGLLGATLVDVLMSSPENDFYVYAGGRSVNRAERLFKRYLDNPRFSFIPFDVRDDYTFDYKFDYIISAASPANPVLYATDPAGVMQTVWEGTRRLLDYGRMHGMERFVFVSSGDVYGEGNGLSMNESYSGYMDPLNLRSCYGMAKRAAETLCISYRSQYGTDTIIVRPCHTYGPHITESDTRACSHFIRNASDGKDIELKSSGSQVRSWCYAVDSAAGIITAMLKGKSGEAYNIADPGTVLSIHDFAAAAAKAGGVNLAVAAPSETEKKGFNVISYSIFDSSKLMCLGWTVEGGYMDKIKSSIDYLSHEKD